jgi:hypothetical protein
MIASDVQDPLRDFWEMCESVCRMWDCEDGGEDIGSEAYARTLDRILAWMESHPELRDTLSGLFIDSVRAEGEVPDAVIVHTMRRLRWPEVYQAAYDFARAYDPRQMNRLSDILSAFNP